MNVKISKQQIGQRIQDFRKRKGLSQESLAKSVGISRPSLVQIESGNRGIDISELQDISFVLGFSLDDFMSSDFDINLGTDSFIKEVKSKPKERISIPTLQVNKFINVLLYILERCAGKPNVGETVLYKLLYFADFNYYELYEEQMTGAQYRKLPFGPVPQKIENIINKLIKNGQLQKIKTEYHGYAQIRYLPLEKPDLRLLKASEKEVIDRVIDQMSDWSAAMLSTYSHGDKPWKVSQFNKDINYELVFYRLPPYSVRVYEDDQQY